MLRASPVPRVPSAILVVGMHRSGTSAVARVLNLVGCQLPDNLFPPHPVDNPAGYWESRELVSINEALLGHFGLGWDDFFSLPRGWHQDAGIRSWRRRILEILGRDWGDAPYLVLKDPRLSRLLPFWLPLLNEHGYEPRIVHVVRDPMEVVASLESRSARTDRLRIMSAERALLLWLRYTSEVEILAGGYPKAILPYTALLADPLAILAQVAVQLDVRWRRAPASVEPRIEAFLDPELRHHVSSAAPEVEGSLLERVREVWTLLAGCEGPDTSARTEILVAARHYLATAERLLRPLLDEKDKRLEALSAEHRRLQTWARDVERRYLELERQVTGAAEENGRLAARLTELEGESGD